MLRTCARAQLQQRLERCQCPYDCIMPGHQAPKCLGTAVQLLLLHCGRQRTKMNSSSGSLADLFFSWIASEIELWLSRRRL